MTDHIRMVRITKGPKHTEEIPLDTAGMLGLVFETESGTLTVSLRHGKLSVSALDGGVSVEPVAANVVDIVRSAR